MQSAPSFFVILFALFLALWPVACLIAALQLSITKQWRRLGQLGLLLPLWTIAASVGLMQVTPFLSTSGATDAVASPLLAAAGVGLSMGLGVAAWWLLYRSVLTKSMMSSGPRRPSYPNRTET